MSRIFSGIVTSTKMNNTVIVTIERKFRHAVYHKVIVRRKKFMAHNENKDVKVGDKVEIEETRPISKNKHFKVIGKVK